MERNTLPSRVAVSQRFSRYTLIVCSALLLCCASAPLVFAAGTITYVQGNYSVPQSSPTSVSVAFKSTQAVGDLNVVVVGWNDTTATVNSVTDKTGNVYTRVVDPTTVSGTLSQSIYVAKNIAAGTNTVTVAFSTGAFSPDIRILEYAGADTSNPIDVTAAATGSGGTTNSGAAATTNTNDLIFGANIVTGLTSGPGSGFTKRLLTSPDGDIAEDKMVSSTGSYNATAPASGKWIMQMVAIRASTGVTGVAPAITSANSTAFTTGTTASFTVTATGTPTPSLTETGALPSGVTFHDNANGTATLGGTPASNSAGTYPITITANNGVGSPATQNFTLTVSQATQAPAITSASSTTFTAGTAASFIVTATGTPTPALTETGALPSGVTFHDNANGTATLSGTASATGTFPITITANNGVGSPATQNFTLTVNQANQAPAITSASSTTFTAGTAGSFTVTATGTPPPSLSQTGALPSGVTFVDNANGTATLNGTPAANAAGTYPITITASNGVGSPATQNFTLTVNPASQPAPISFVQLNYATPQGGNSTVKVTYTKAQNVGDLNVVVVGWNDSTARIASLSDSAGNTYALAVGPTVQSGTATQAIYYAQNIRSAAANSNTVTVAFNTSAISPDIRIAEYGGIASTNALDVVATAQGSGATSNSGSATTTNANDLLVGANLVQQLTNGPGTNYTNRVITSPDSDILEDSIVTATGSYNASASLSGGGWIMQMAAFRGSSGGTTGSSPSITSANAATFTAGTAGSFTVTATGSPTPSLTETGSLSSGVTFVDNGNGTATLSGTPAATSAGTYPITITASNGVGSPATQNFTLTVNSSDTQPPTAPASLAAAAVSAATINLNWTASTDNVGVTGYLIARCVGAGCANFSQIATTAATTYSDTSLSPNTSYTYEVQATDAAGNLSPYSNPATATTPQPPSGLVAAYSFDEGSGSTITDLSGNGNNGTLSNTSWTTSGKFGSALVFDGSSSLVTINDSPSLDLTTGMTLEAWVNPSAVTSDWRDVVYKGNDNYFLEDTTSATAPGGGGTFGSNNLVAFGTAALPVNTWSHLAVTYDGATLRLYINGALVSSLAQTGNIATSTNPLQIGGDTFFGQYFAGTIDEVRVYNIPLNQTQIQADMTTAVGTELTVTPRSSVLTFTGSQQFTATGNTAGLTWSVDGVIGGSSTVGTITSSGLYTPPAAVGTHTITATTSASSANAMVYVTNYPGTFTFHNDNSRTGQNSSETVLTPANVNQNQFGKLFSYSLDGLAYASPLYVANVNIPSQGYHNVVYIATENDSVYAWDADGRSTTPLWQVSFLGSGATTVPCGDTGECGDIPDQIGITGTPAIDSSTGTLYVVATTKESGGYVQRLHALDIATGAEKFGGPVVIQATIPGTGDGSQTGQLSFDPLRENQRASLLLANGVVYIGWASHGDQPPWHGWVMGYSASSLQRTMAYCVSPNGYGGGVWMSDGGLATDSTGNLFFTTGNGDFTANSGGTDYGDSVVKLSSSASVVDYFTPYDQSYMESNDIDLASAGPVLLVDQPGPVPHLLIAAGKSGSIYVINRDDMGQFNPNSNSQIVQTLQSILPNGNLEEGNFSAPVFFNNFVYFAAVDDYLKAFQLSNGTLSPAPSSQSAETYPNRGGSFSISANGTSDGILWAVQDNSPGNGVLLAYDANNLANELYNSSQSGSRDTLGVAAKFTIPTVANGKVFVVANGQLVIYGLLP